MLLYSGACTGLKFGVYRFCSKDLSVLAFFHFVIVPFTSFCKKKIITFIVVNLCER